MLEATMSSLRFLRSLLLVLPLLLAPRFPAHAQEVEITSGPICDTQEQVEQFVALYDGDAQSTAEKVNAGEHNPTACVVSGMAYVRGRELGRTRTKDTTFQIVPILVLGIVTENGMQSVAPTRYFSAVRIKEISI
jgi:hypothetical protein